MKTVHFSGYSESINYRENYRELHNYRELYNYNSNTELELPKNETMVSQPTK